MPEVKKLGDNVTLIDNTKEVRNALDDAVSTALNLIGMQAEKNAKALCPVDTGRLRNSITYTFSGAGAMTQVFSDNNKNSFGSEIGSMEGDKTKTVYIGTNVEYAPYVELDGTKNHPNGQAHFLRDAVQNNVSEYRRILESCLRGKK